MSSISRMEEKGTVSVSFAGAYERYHELAEGRARKLAEESAVRSQFDKFLRRRVKTSTERSGFDRIQLCRDALNVLDSKGWNRSFHQRLFHDQFIRACARVFFKTDKPGSFARAHQAILELNSWENLTQEVLISTPRRFGKTISVSMFAAAMVYACPNVEISIYSTCKRISQKLLRNVLKFLAIIYDGMGVDGMKELRSNMEEVMLQGPESAQDVRLVNSYPSKVGVVVRDR